jgi:hypothetical protein
MLRLVSLTPLCRHPVWAKICTEAEDVKAQITADMIALHDQQDAYALARLILAHTYGGEDEADAIVEGLLAEFDCDLAAAGR